MQLARPVKIKRVEPFQVKLSLVLRLSESSTADCKQVTSQVHNNVSLLNLDLHQVKVDKAADFVATRKLSSDIESVLES
jgi:hypothetical protein